MALKFRLRTIPLLVTMALVVLGVSLARWQTRRALEKEAIQARIEERAALPPLQLGAGTSATAPLAYQKVSMMGEFVSTWPVYLDNRPLHGVAGFYVLMPFKLRGSDVHVLVARGWLARNAVERSRLPPLSTPSGTVQVDGMVRESIDRVMQLGQPETVKPTAIVQNITPQQIAAASKLNMQAYVVEQTSDTQDGLQRDWPLPSSGADRNRGYEFQWYALSLMAVIFFVVTGFRRGKHSKEAS